VLVVLLAASGGLALEAVAAQVGLDACRAKFVRVYAEQTGVVRGARLEAVASLVHRLERGIRLMRVRWPPHLHGTPRRPESIPSFVAAGFRQDAAMDDDAKRAIALFRLGVLGPLVNARLSTATGVRTSSRRRAGAM
jgi:hypothetical protein